MTRSYSSKLNVEEAKAQYLENIKQICEELSNPVFIPFKQEDEVFARQHLDVDVFDFTFSVEETLRRVNSVERMVCTRYHSLIFASLCGKPVLPVAYAPKVSSLSDRLNIPSYSPHKEMPLEFTYPENIKYMKKQAIKNFDLVENSINGDQIDHAIQK